MLKINILNCVTKMNDADDSTIKELDFVIMHHVMKKKYLLSIHSRLRKLLENSNSDIATTHATMQTATGSFGMSFAVKKNEKIVHTAKTKINFFCIKKFTCLMGL